MKFKNLRLAAKLGLGFGLCVALTIFLGISSASRASALNQSVKALENDSLVAFQAFAEMSESTMGARAFLYKSMLASSPADKSSAAKSLNSELEQLKTSFEDYEKSIVIEEDRRLFETVRSNWQAFESLKDELGKSSASEMMKKTDASYDKFQASFAKLLDWNKQRAKELAKNAENTYHSGVKQNYTTLAICVLLAIAACFVVTRSVTLPLSLVTDRMFKLQTICMMALRGAIEAMAQGDLVHQMKTGTTEVPYESQDEIGKVAASFNELLSNMKATIGTFEEARENLRGLIGDVSKTAQNVAQSSEILSTTAARSNATSEEIGQSIQQVAHASEESAQTSTQIARGSEQLAIGATEASNAMEKLETAVQSVRQGSQEQQNATQRANEIAAEGGQAVQQTISSMDRIARQVSLSEQAIRELGDKQAQIGAIVQAIDEIAEQTNLLALNAAIEAARAGEHGRGFAVVAEEVRKLAERSSASTKEIADLIGMVREGVEKAIESMTASAEEVAEGSKSSDAAKAALAEILKGIADVQTLAQQNDKLVQSMAQDARVVSDAITNVASVSEETAAGAQEMSASSEEMAAAAQQASAAVQEQSNGIAEVSRMSGDLMAASEQLQSMVSAFKINLETRSEAKPDLKVAA